MHSFGHLAQAKTEARSIVTEGDHMHCPPTGVPTVLKTTAPNEPSQGEYAMCSKFQQ
jgi:hypothetical protein